MKKHLLSAADLSRDDAELVLTTADEKKRMPPARVSPRLSAEEIRVIREWVKAGAPARGP